MLIKKKYILLILALMMFIWRLLLYPKLKEKKIASVELLDAIVHLALFFGAVQTLDNTVPIKKPLNYFKTPAEF